MSDYIDRQAAIDAVSTMFAPAPTQKDMVEDCLEIIENLPSVEVEPVINCIDYITDEIAKKIIEEANKACANCQEWVCDECEYRRWRNKR